MRLRIEPCPHTGDGVHTWLLGQANRCRWSGLAPATTAGVLREASGNCGRSVPEREIDDAVRKAFESDPPVGNRSPRAKGRLHRRPPVWPERDPDRIAAIAASGIGLADLWHVSPIWRDDDQNLTEVIIDALFPGDPLLCCGWSKSNFDTRLRSAWRGELSRAQLIVPSPMSAVWGITKDGKPSKHTESNTGPRRWLVIESDQGAIDQQAAVLLHLAQSAPLVLVVHSGGKSLHGWFLVAGQPEEKVHKFFRYAHALGADKKLWKPEQFARMPDAQRDNGNRQTVFFFNPQPLHAHAS
jgi:hypothetical protein